MSNRVIIEKQKTGKTTYLMNEIDRMIKDGMNIIILDSATEHEDKSLLKKVVNKYSNAEEIFITDKNLIDIDNENIYEYINHFSKHFPTEILKNNKGKILCFDLSYFLERGHDIYDETNDINLYKYYRRLYNNLAQQITLVTILAARYGIIDNSIVVMDEIEFPIVDYDVSIFEENISFLASVHPENAFGTFYENFEKIKFKVYRKD